MNRNQVTRIASQESTRREHSPKKQKRHTVLAERKRSRSVVFDSCDPMDYSLPGSSVHGIFQAKVLEWVAISFSRGSYQPRDQTRVSCIIGKHFTVWATREVHALCWKGMSYKGQEIEQESLQISEVHFLQFWRLGCLWTRYWQNYCLVKDYFLIPTCLFPLCSHL